MNLAPTVALWVTLLGSHFLLGLGWIFSILLGVGLAMTVDWLQL